MPAWKIKFISELKKAKITPLIKKRDPFDSKNQSTISITFEQISDNDSISVQYLQKKFSNQDALIFVTDASETTDSKKIVHAALLDISETLDSISHKI